MTTLVRLTTCAAIAALAAVGAGPGAAQQKGSSGHDGPAEMLAAQLRTQGFACNKPVTAERDAAHSKPDGAAWTVKCANGAYRMRLIPDRAATVERLD